MKATLRAKSNMTKNREGHSADRVSQNEKLEGHTAGKVEFGGLKAMPLRKWSIQGVIMTLLITPVARRHPHATMVPDRKNEPRKIKAGLEGCCGSYEGRVGLVAGAKKNGYLWVI